MLFFFISGDLITGNVLTYISDLTLVNFILVFSLKVNFRVRGISGIIGKSGGIA